MAQVELNIGGRSYTVACRDGEEAHLTSLGAVVAAKAEEARRAVGGVNEVRQMLFAALLLADDQHGAAANAAAATDSALASEDLVVDALERLAARVESLADALEAGGASA